MHVVILMATYNGGFYLNEQLISFKNQSYMDWALWISDDGSTDNTKAVISDFATALTDKNIQILEGPRKGFAANFMALICNPIIKADAYAYSDQDDIWFDDKIERAVNFLSSIPSEIPSLYCSRTQYVDLNNKPLGFSIAYSRPTIFANAMIQNIAGGNTMVINNAARELLMQAGSTIDIELHDWWTYLLVTGSGGKVFFDHEPTVRYRQHPNNLWGMNTTLRAQIIRIKKLFGGRFQHWNDLHVMALRSNERLLNSENKKILNQFSLIRKQGLIARLIGLKSAGVYRQTLMGNLGLIVAAIFGKI